MTKKLIVCFLLLISNFAFSQIGINTDEPNTKTLLHISEKLKTSDTDADKAKGIIIPRLNNTERDKLKSNIVSTQTEQDNNSLMIFNTDENCYNYWNTDDNAWKSLCGTTGNATFTYSCDTDITLHGNYIEKEETTSNEYITIEVKVSKIGDYFVTATSTNDNGFSFVGSGTFSSTGSQIIYLYAQGTPSKRTFYNDGTAHPDIFTISSSSSGDQEPCTINVDVNWPKASYTINCQSTIVNGTYNKGYELNTKSTDNNTIILNINVHKTGSFEVTTNTVNGIRFYVKDYFTKTGNQYVTLVGSGTPTTNNDFDITITSNTTSGNATCTATIPITLPELTVGIIGTSDWSWYTHRKNAFLKTANFSPTGKVKIDKISIADSWNGISTQTAKSNLNNAAIKKPDIILYYAFLQDPDKDLGIALSTYTKNGGVLIYGTSNNTSSVTKFLLEGIYGETHPPIPYDRGNNSSSNVFQINNLPEDPIINGPFGNLSGRFWGEDTYGSVFVSNLPSTAIQIASAHTPNKNNNISPDDSIIWYDNSHNFVYVGDSTASSNSSSSKTGWPALFYSTSGLPTTKMYGYWDSNTSGAKYVYNAALDFNILAWALERAAEIGINEH